MSTRCSIVFRVGTNRDNWLVTYRHHDGRPPNVVDDLRHFQSFLQFFHSPITTLTEHPYVPVYECVVSNWLTFMKNYIHYLFCTHTDRKISWEDLFKDPKDLLFSRKEELHLNPEWNWFKSSICDYYVCLHPKIHKNATFVRWIYEVRTNKAPWQVIKKIYNADATANGAAIIFKEEHDVGYQEQVTIYHRQHGEPSTIMRQLNDFFTVLKRFKGKYGRDWVKFLRAASTASNWVYFMKRGLEYWLLYANSVPNDRFEICLTDYEACPHGLHGDIAYYFEVNLEQFEKPWEITSSLAESKHFQNL